MIPILMLFSVYYIGEVEQQEISLVNSMGPKGITHLLILGRPQFTRVPGKESQQIIGVNKFEREIKKLTTHQLQSEHGMCTLGTLA